MTALPASPTPGPAQRRTARGGLAGWQVRRMHALAAETLATLTVARMASEARLSPKHFSRAFTASLGQNPTHWLTKARVDRAAALLTTTGLGVSEIARLVGYKSAAQLTRAFRARRGETPSDHRRR